MPILTCFDNSLANYEKITTSIVICSSSPSSDFDKSIDHTWISFPEPLHHQHHHHSNLNENHPIETTPKSTLSSSKLSDLFSPKSKSLLNNPVCQLVSELRKHFNRKTQIHRDLQSNFVPERETLEQGIREICRGWAPTMVDRMQRFITHEFVMTHPKHP